jgi:hypothetical protein
VGDDAVGSIDLPGAMDVYDLDATAGTVAYFSAAADNCQSPPNLRWIVEATDGSAILGISSICNDIGRVVFPKHIPYRIRVYGADASTGGYRVRWRTSKE